MQTEGERRLSPDRSFRQGKREEGVGLDFGVRFCWKLAFKKSKQKRQLLILLFGVLLGNTRSNRKCMGNCFGLTAQKLRVNLHCSQTEAGLTLYALVRVFTLGQEVCYWQDYQVKV